jgi:hypothetical protein
MNEKQLDFDTVSLDPVNMDCTTEFIEVSDGGLCYWSMNVNIDREVCFDLMINSNA